MVYFVLGLYKIKSSVKANNEKKYKRIRKCQQKSRTDVAPVVIRPVLVRLEGASRVLTEKIYTERRKHDAADDLKRNLVRIDKFGHKT